jgi:hypothetical protein
MRGHRFGDRLIRKAGAATSIGSRSGNVRAPGALRQVLEQMADAVRRM